MHAKKLTAVVALLMALTVSSQAQDALTNGLVGYYPFNGNLNDQSGGGNNAALIGSDWRYGVDRFNHANSLHLNSTSAPTADLDGAYVVAARSAKLDFNRDFTVSIWLNISDRVSSYYVHTLISNGRDTDAANLRLISNAGNGVDWLQFICNPTAGDVHASVPSLRNVWWQAVAVRAGNNLSLYRNGALVASSPLSAALLNSTAILFGRHNNGGTTSTGSYSLAGGIDDVRMYDRALSSQEVKQLYVWEANQLPFVAISVKTVRLELYVTPGTTNQIFWSIDLSTWTPYGPPFVATNSTMVQDVDLAAYPQFFDVRLKLDERPATLILTNSASQYAADPVRVVAYLDNNGPAIPVGSRTSGWDPQETWTMSLSALASGQAYTFELQDTAFSNVVIPPRSNPIVISAGASLSGYMYNNGQGGYFGWHMQWSWGP